MVIPAALHVDTCIDCLPSSQPAQLSFAAPQLDAAPVSAVPALQMAYDEASKSMTPDRTTAVEWSARSRESDPALLLEQGKQGAAVARLQARLARLGYPVSKIDGIFGPQTQAAVMRFQQANGLVVDGIVDASSWVKLNAAITQSGVVPPTPLAQPELIPIQGTQPESAVLLAAATTSMVSQPMLTASASSTPPSSPKSGWIVVLVILQGFGWLVILRELNQELVLFTGRSWFPSKRVAAKRNATLGI